LELVSELILDFDNHEPNVIVLILRTEENM